MAQRAFEGGLHLHVLELGDSEVEVLDGGRWKPLTPLGGYPGSVRTDRATGSLPAFVGATQGWIESRFDLSPFLGRKIRIRLRAFDPPAPALLFVAMAGEDRLRFVRRVVEHRLVDVDDHRRRQCGEVAFLLDRRRPGRIAECSIERRDRRSRVASRTSRERADLDRLAASGMHLTLLIGQGEPVYERFEHEGTVAVLEAAPQVDLRRLPARDHTFRAPWLQRRVHDEFDRAITEAQSRRPA